MAIKDFLYLRGINALSIAGDNFLLSTYKIEIDLFISSQGPVYR